MKQLFFALSLLLVCVYAQTEVVTTVGPNGTYATIKEAYTYVAALPKNATVRFVVEIEAGTYTEQIVVKRANVTFRASSEPVIIQFNSPRNTKGGANNATFTITTNGDNFRMYDISLVDISPETVNIATTALSIAAYNASFYNVKVYGFQDTLWLANSRSYAYFKNSYIEGGVDFIYGSGIAFFDSCTLASNRAGSVTAMQGGTATGTGTYVFRFCTLIATIPSGPLATLRNASLSFSSPSEFPRSCYLGRPWDQYSRVAYLFTEIGEHITQEGWSSWQVPAGQLYGEYNTTGRGAFNPGRVSFSTLLTPEQATNYTFAHFFGQSPFWLDTSYAPATCSAQYGQCGGIGFSGKACCEAPYVCQEQNPYYSQCVANPAPAPVVDTTVTLYDKAPGAVESVAISNEVQGSVHWVAGAPGSNIVVQAVVTDVVADNIRTTVDPVSTFLNIAVTYYGIAGPTIDVYVTYPSNLLIASADTYLYNGTITTPDFSACTALSCTVHEATAACPACCASGACTADGCQ